MYFYNLYGRRVCYLLWGKYSARLMIVFSIVRNWSRKQGVIFTYNLFPIMIQIYTKILKSPSFFISCIKFPKIFIERFSGTSLISRSVNNSNSYWFGVWQMDFKKKSFNVITIKILLCIARVVSNIEGIPSSVSISVTT